MPDRNSETDEFFHSAFKALTGYRPMCWQSRLFRDHFVAGELPSAIDIPTGLGKTAVMAIWLAALSWQMRTRSIPTLPRRLVYIVDRRAVVDQATRFAEMLQRNLQEEAEANDLATALRLHERALPISTLRGQFVDNREWLEDPGRPAIVVGTVDMIGSRLLFEGYGVSRKMRPYHAGFLGADALVVLDEAHLVPPFEHLMRAIEADTSLHAKDESDRTLLPPFMLLPLSATQRGDSGTSFFRLEEKDADSTATKRLGAVKRLRLQELTELSPQDQQLAEAAWALRANEAGEPRRVIVFCDRRDKKEGGSGLSAQGVKQAIEMIAAGGKKKEIPKTDIHTVELLVGARRVHERENLDEKLRKLGFIDGKGPLKKPAFLVATSAGEVGVDIDADHLVCDLVAWERMVQRLGRVNRRGEGEADVVVFWATPQIKKPDEPTDAEKRALTAFAAHAVVERLPNDGGRYDASPGALRDIAGLARRDRVLKARIDAATTPEPLRPALSRALVDAWSMTSLKDHTGRPEIAPWLRGWEPSRPQTTIVWRQHLPVRAGEIGWPRTAADRKEIEEFFEAAPPHESEKLETETDRVVGWLKMRADSLSRSKADHSIDSPRVDEELAESAEPDGNEAEPDGAEALLKPTKSFGPNEIVAIALSRGGDITSYGLQALRMEMKGQKDQFRSGLAGKTLVIDARFGGLDADGMLDVNIDDCVCSADTDEKWNARVKLRVRVEQKIDEHKPESTPGDWRFEDRFVRSRNPEGDATEWLVVEHLKDSANKEDARSVSAMPQTLAEHQDWAESHARNIAARLGLSGDAADTLALAARLHDEGKKASRWQRAFKAPRDAKNFALSGPLAKTRGPIDQAILDGYRHEFGSLPYVEESDAVNALPKDWRDLVLHLVAAHHGQARPVIETRGCETGPPSVLEAQARDAALRFARLQKRWGPWGLAWWEALLRAADQQASRALENLPRGKN